MDNSQDPFPALQGYRLSRQNGTLDSLGVDGLLYISDELRPQVGRGSVGLQVKSSKQACKSFHRERGGKQRSHYFPGFNGLYDHDMTLLVGQNSSDVIREDFGVELCALSDKVSNPDNKEVSDFLAQAMNTHVAEGVSRRLYDHCVKGRRDWCIDLYAYDTRRKFNPCGTIYEHSRRHINPRR
ncbi:MAG: hypothetical protein WCJ70_00995 [bacterium]